MVYIQCDIKGYEEFIITVDDDDFQDYLEEAYETYEDEEHGGKFLLIDDILEFKWYVEECDINKLRHDRLYNTKTHYMENTWVRFCNKAINNYIAKKVLENKPIPFIETQQ